jgi:predicted alpha/beta-hydrolase family hydrolase
MTSEAQADSPIPGVRGIVFVGFPLHPAGKPGTSRAGHLGSIGVPMLFVQGTRDALADRELMNQTCRALGPRATLHEIDGADHAFAVRRDLQPHETPAGPGRGPGREGPGDVRIRIAQIVAGWVLDQV